MCVSSKLLSHDENCFAKLSVTPILLVEMKRLLKYVAYAVTPMYYTLVFNLNESTISVNEHLLIAVNPFRLSVRSL